jgi:RimJ/RimL family protein N-acetyltransferase
VGACGAYDPTRQAWRTQALSERARSAERAAFIEQARPRVLRDPHCRLRQSIWCDEQSRRFDALHHIKVEHRRLEIGVTWIGTAFQRTHINTEAKLLQLRYAFDVLVEVPAN